MLIRLVCVTALFFVMGLTAQADDKRDQEAVTFMVELILFERQLCNLIPGDGSDKSVCYENFKRETRSAAEPNSPEIMLEVLEYGLPSKQIWAALAVSLDGKRMYLAQKANSRLQAYTWAGEDCYNEADPSDRCLIATTSSQYEEDEGWLTLLHCRRGDQELYLPDKGHSAQSAQINAFGDAHEFFEYSPKECKILLTADVFEVVNKYGPP